jgi:hypothetical protein
MGDASDNSDAEVQKLLTESEGTDYVRFIMCNITGEPYIKAVPKRHLPAFYKHGLPFWEGTDGKGRKGKVGMEGKGRDGREGRKGGWKGRRRGSLSAS